jgi:hypothetical protein
MTEAEKILRLAKGDFADAFQVLERQMGVLVLRTQVLLSLSGIVITVTGFSGKAIAQTSALARLCIAVGILVVLSAAVVAFIGVLRLKWLTQIVSDDPIETLNRGITMRDRKSSFLNLSVVLFVIGLSFYCVSIAQLLIATKTVP